VAPDAVSAEAGVDGVDGLEAEGADRGLRHAWGSIAEVYHSLLCGATIHTPMVQVSSGRGGGPDAWGGPHGQLPPQPPACCGVLRGRGACLGDGSGKGAARAALPGCPRVGPTLEGPRAGMVGPDATPRTRPFPGEFSLAPPEASLPSTGIFKHSPVGAQKTRKNRGAGHPVRSGFGRGGPPPCFSRVVSRNAGTRGRSGGRVRLLKPGGRWLLAGFGGGGRARRGGGGALSRWGPGRGVFSGPPFPPPRGAGRRAAMAGGRGGPTPASPQGGRVATGEGPWAAGGRRAEDAAGASP